LKVHSNDIVIEDIMNFGVNNPDHENKETPGVGAGTRLALPDL
jgi:hypothetical protein